MPDVFSIGLGGGSLVVEDEASGGMSIGPRSVGYKLTKDALIFGGKTLTTSDIVVAAGRADFGRSVQGGASATVIDRKGAD